MKGQKIMFCCPFCFHLACTISAFISFTPEWLFLSDCVNERTTTSTDITIHQKELYLLNSVIATSWTTHTSWRIPMREKIIAQFLIFCLTLAKPITNSYDGSVYMWLCIWLLTIGCWYQSLSWVYISHYALHFIFLTFNDQPCHHK